MPMTKADFQEIADAVAEAKRDVEYSLPPQYDHKAALRALEFATKELATACARRRKTGAGAFNRQRFVDACGFPEA